MIAFAAVFALVAEAGTIVGSPLLSIGNAGDWSKTRLVIFFVLGLVGATMFIATDASAKLRDSARNLKETWPTARKRVLSVAALTLGSAAVAAVAAQFLSGSSDSRIPALTAIAVACAMLLVTNRTSIARKPEWGFLTLCLSMGLIMCVSVPMTTRICWDDQIHYDNTLSLSYLTGATYTFADRDVVTLEKLTEAVRAYAPNTDEPPVVSLHRNAVDAFNDLEAGLADDGAFKLKGTATAANGSYLQASSIAYVPAAAGLWIGRLLHLPFAGTFFMGKLFGLLFYALVFFFAIKPLRSGKLLVSAIGLLPTTVFMATNYSYDPWIVSLLALSFCKLASFLQDARRNMDAPAAASILLPFFLALLPKAIYLPLGLVFLCIPARRFQGAWSRKRFIAGVSLVALAPIALILLPTFVGFASGASIGDTRGGDVNAAGQISYILSHPFEALKTLVSYTLWIFSPVNYLDGGLLNFPYLFGGNVDHIKMGSLIVPGPVCPLFADGGLLAKRILALLWLLGFVIVSFTDHANDTRYCNSPAIGATTVVGIVLSYLLICAALYITFTTVGLPFVVGVQYRYFFPFFVPVLLLCCNAYTRFRPIPNAYPYAVLGYFTALCAATVGLIFLSLF